ncbi:hypothetical protein Hdeb2414_s0013g00410391 [Helianthus debilis subsp. tardiflorus]
MSKHNQLDENWIMRTMLGAMLIDQSQGNLQLKLPTRNSVYLRGLLSESSVKERGFSRKCLNIISLMRIGL